MLAEDYFEEESQDCGKLGEPRVGRERVFLRGRINTSMLLSVARQRVGRRRSTLSDGVGESVSRIECGGCAGWFDRSVVPGGAGEI